MRLLTVAGAVLILAWAGWRFALPIAWSAGTGAPIDLAAEPEQTPIDPPERVQVTRGDKVFTVEKTHRYVVSGEVLSATAYDVAWTNELFDVDVGLLWGPRREEFKRRFTFFQMGRWLFWRSDQPVAEELRAEVTRHLSNNHLIPAEGRRHLRSAVRWASRGDRVRIEGALVRVLDADGAVLTRSSTSRDDTGDGACEIIWVDSLQINGRVYR
jgi:hypothetical protein